VARCGISALGLSARYRLGRRPGGAFSLASLGSKVRFHLDPSDVSTLRLASTGNPPVPASDHGGAINEWFTTALSVLVTSLTQNVVSTNRPAYSSPLSGGGINGLSCLDFDGANDGIGSPTTNVSFPAGVARARLFSVFAHDSGPTTGNFDWVAGIPATGNRLWFRARGGTGTAVHHSGLVSTAASGGDGNPEPGPTIDLSAYPQAAKVAEVGFDLSGSPEVVHCRVEGTSDTTANVSPGTPYSEFPAGPHSFFVGSQTHTGSSPFDGKIGEIVLLINSNTTDEGNVRSYLKAKWGVA
jgi:hypothetical protein